MLDLYDRHKQQVDRVLFFALITLSIFVFFTLLFEYLAPFFFGLLIALLMNPLINLMMKRLHFKRWLASLIGLLIFLGTISSLGV